MNSLANLNMLVLGLGASGLALARWLVRCGAQVTVADTRAQPPRLQALGESLPSVRFVHAPLDEELLSLASFDAVYKSPGLAPQAISAVVAAARTLNLLVGNELTLFADALAQLKSDSCYAPQLIGITGTNGKTTVTSLTGLLLQRAGRSVAVAGNIGPTLLDTLADRLDTQRAHGTALPDAWVLELSSFQLDGVRNFEPSVATVLNISQDHLDWHQTLAAYVAAKNHIYGDHALMLLNRDDPVVMAALPAQVKGKPVRRFQTFGSDEPKRPGDYGIETVNGMAWLVHAAEADETFRRRKGEDVELHIQRLMPVEALRIRGRHNALNALAALALATAAGSGLAPLLHGLREYRGEPHRVEPVAVIDDVEYFDDSKGTNVGATVAALAGLGVDRKLVLILGGEGKGQDFSPLVEPVSRYARAVVLIGRDAPVIAAALEQTAVPLLPASTLPEAVTIAAAQSRTGDAVLMSPACASFDMFDNYEHRARVFCEAVQALAQEHGVVA